MKLFIINGENNGEKLEIIINESLFVKDIKKKLDEIYNGNGNFSKYYFVLIHKNIILLDDNSIKHYKICENDEIWFGKIENYLRNDDVIVHVIIVKGLIQSDEHLIVKMNDNISIIKSIIERVRSKIINIWNIKGEQMENNQIITEIDSNEYLKLIIIYDDENGNKIFNTFDEWCHFHDKYWVNGYLYIDDIRDNNQNESIRKILINRIIKIKQIISSNNTIDDRLNQNLSDLPTSFLNSMILFSIDMINRIVDICDDYWRFVINQYENDVVRIFKQYHYDAIRAALWDFSNIRKYNNKTNKLVSDVIIDALDYFVNYLNDSSNDWQYWLRIWMNQYLLRPFSESDLNEAINESISNRFTIQTRMNREDRKNFIQFKPETIFKAKQSISALFNVDIKYLHCIKPGGDSKPNDEDKFDDEFVIEILFNMDDIEILRSLGRGTFAKIILCRDKISNKQFVLKKSIQNDGDLYRDINIYSKLSSSRSIMNYYGLFRDKENICIGMEYMSGGSLKCYLSKGKHLTEQEIVKISFEILTQIKELHKLGIIHRDIKPDNIVLDEHNHAKLIDFGLSKYTIGLTSKDLLYKLKAYVPGKIYYMAPELIKGEAYSEKIDIWSFGMVIIEMVTGKIPFHWLKECQLIIEIPLFTKYEFDPILQISNELKRFIHLCLNTNPDERPDAGFLIKSTLFISYL